MAVLSSLGKLLGAVILTLSLIALVMTSTLAGVTARDSLQPVFVNIIGQQVTIQMSPVDLADSKAAMDQQCAQAGGGTIYQTVEMVGENTTLTINCTQLSTTAASGIPALFGEAVFQTLYYKSYSCSLISCLLNRGGPEGSIVLLSAHANGFFNGVVPYAIAGMIIGIIVIVVSARKPQSILRTAGKSILSAGIPYVIILITKGMLPIPSESSGIASFVTGVIDSMAAMFLVLLVVGIVMVAGGMVWSRISPESAERPKEKRKRE